MKSRKLDKKTEATAEPAKTKTTDAKKKDESAKKVAAAPKKATK